MVTVQVSQHWCELTLLFLGEFGLSMAWVITELLTVTSKQETMLY